MSGEFMLEKRLEDCWDWVTREDLARFALWALERAKLDARPPAGERFLDAEGFPWTGRVGFVDELCALFEAKVKAHAHGLGLGPYEWHARLACLNENPVSTRGSAGAAPEGALAPSGGAP